MASILVHENPIRVGALTSDPGTADNGTIYYNTTTGKLRFREAGSFQTVATAASVTLQSAYDNDADGGGVSITTNSTDGALIVAGTESFDVTANAGLNVNPTTPGSNNSFDLTNSGTGIGLNLDQTNSANVTSALDVDHAGTGAAAIGAKISMSGATASGDAVEVNHAGTGIGIDLNITNASNTQNGLDVNHAGSGSAIKAFGTTGYAVEAVSTTTTLATVSAAANSTGIAIQALGGTSSTNPAVRITTGGTAPHIRLDAQTSGTLGIKAPATVTTPYTLTLPPDPGSSGQVLRTDGSGVATWITVATTLDGAYANDPDGGGATINTTATDGSVIINGTEALQVIATQGFDVNPTTPGANDVVDIINSGTGMGIDLDQTSSSNNTSGIDVSHAGTGSTVAGVRVGITAGAAAGDGIEINHAGSGFGIDVNMTSTGTGVDVDTSGGGIGVNVDGAGPAALFRSTGSSVRTFVARLNNATNTNGVGLFEVQNASCTSECLETFQGGLGEGITVTQNLAGNNADGIRVDHAGTGSGAQGVNVNLTGTGYAGKGIRVNVSSATATGKAVEINNAGTGIGLSMLQTGTGTGVSIDHSGSAGTALVALKSGSAGLAANIQINNASNGNVACFVTTAGTGQGAQVNTTNAATTSTTLSVNQSGLGFVGAFNATNASNNVPAVYIENAGTGVSAKGLQLAMSGAAAAGEAVEITHSSSTSTGDALEVNHSGTGIGIDLNMTNASSGVGLDLSMAGGTNFGINATAGATHNQFLASFQTDTTTGGSAVQMVTSNAAATGVTSSVYNAGGGTALQIQHLKAAGTSTGLDFTNAGLGIGASFTSSLSTNNVAAFQVSHAGTGSSAIGAKVSMTAATAAGDAVEINHAGLGFGIDLNVTNASNSSNAIDISHAGTGIGVRALVSGTGTAVYATSADVGVIAETTSVGASPSIKSFSANGRHLQLFDTGGSNNWTLRVPTLTSHSWIIPANNAAGSLTNDGSGNLSWTNMTLQQVYDNDANGSDALITTNSTDGSVVIAGTEGFQVTGNKGLIVNPTTPGTNTGATFTYAAAGTGAAAVFVDCNSTSGATIGVKVDQVAANATAHGIQVYMEPASTGIGVSVPVDGAGHGISTAISSAANVSTAVLASHAGTGAAAIGAKISMTAATAAGDAVEINHAGTGLGIDLNYTNAASSGTALDIAYAGQGKAINVSSSGVNPSLDINNTGGDVAIQANTVSGGGITVKATAGNNKANELLNASAASSTATLRNTNTSGPVLGLLGATSGTLSIKTTNVTTDHSWTLPGTQGGSSTVLTNNGSGVLSWVSGSSFTTLQNAYDNDADGSDATITTNATDGSVVIAGDQSLKVSATNGLDMTTVAITTSTVNGGLTIAPNGTGFIRTTTTGDTRGVNSTDFQRVRSSTFMVASGNGAALIGCQNSQAGGQNSTVIGGTNNFATAQNAVMIGGNNNADSTGNTNCVIAAGSSHSLLSTATNVALIAGSSNQNTGASNNSAIIGGNNNIIGGTNAVVVGGQRNKTSHNYAVAMGFGADTTAAADVVIGNNTAAVAAATSNVHFRVDGTASDVHIGRATDQASVVGATNKLALHTILASNQSRATRIRAHDSLTATYDLQLPDAQGLANTVLSNDGSGNLSWASGADSFPISFFSPSGTGALQTEELQGQVYNFTSGGTEKVVAFIKVPTKHNSSRQISLKAMIYSPSTTNTIFLKATTYLIRPGTEAVDSTANSYVSTNAALTNTTPANTPREITLDLTGSTGLINAIAAAAGHMLRIELTRGTDTDTADIRLIPQSTEIIF